ncbi:MAG: FAD-binding oxidoreductase [Flavobacteriales bacterium]|jgi:ferredoxin-NADP reductase
MEAQRVTILKTEYVTLDVKRFVLTRPKGFRFMPGQGCMVSIDMEGLREEKRAFTFTNLPSARTLELIVKIYPGHKGVTQQMSLMRKGDALLLHEVFGTITYKGPGFFFAGGAGITPFLAIFRQLHKEGRLKGSTLVYSNKAASDVIMDEELTAMLGRNYLKTFTRQGVIGFRDRRIDKDTLITLVQDFDQHFYLCGPPEFVGDLQRMLVELGASPESLVFEA